MGYFSKIFIVECQSLFMPKKYTGPERRKGRESLFADFELLEHDTFKTSLLYQALLKGKKKIVLKQGRAMREVDLQQLKDFPAEQTAKNPNLPKPKFKRNPRRN